ncbi:DUF4973 domain-containing protein [Gaoshiqia sp. Z1-71]|uniref:DUF4973 domain-containing protein n=1 Tax=Gaoshiqia hydrogeniformans TaxID=3290090 RepID=UPI003BF77A84
MVTVICCVSCNNEWEDEQYVQLASFKAEPNSNGVTDTYLRYYPEGKVTYKLPVIVSGSTPNAVNRTIRIGLDLDTLAILNIEQYGHREELYYKALESKYYSFPETIDIPAGESTVVLPIEFTLGDLDQSDKWVLPLMILDDPSGNYEVNPRKHYSRALLRISPFNDYSGTYSGTLYKIVLEGDNQNPLTLNSHRTYVVDDKTVFIYAGNRNIDYQDRKLYKIFIEFTDERVDLRTKKLRLYTDNPEINLNVVGQPSYSVEEAMDATKPYLKHIYVTLNLSYEFVDYTSVPGNSLRYSVSGSLSMQRDLNTLIPDEDQQIQW